MSQSSLPQTGHQNVGHVDAGPYLANAWANIYEKIFTGNYAASRGVVPGILNELEGGNSGGNVTVQSGNGICIGRLFQSTATETFTPSAPSTNPRVDVVVMAENGSASPISSGTATPNTLIFPSSLVDYKNASSIPEYTCRLVILPGNEAASPVAPTLDVNESGLYMVPLYQYEISTGGSISNAVDRRQAINVPSRILIDEQLGDGIVSSLTFSSISQIYTHLELDVQFAPSTLPSTLFVTTSYVGTYYYNGTYSGSSASGVQIGNANVGHYRILIPFYTGNQQKTMKINGSEVTAGPTLTTMDGSGLVPSASPVTQVTLTSGTLTANTVARLYGVVS